MGIKYSIKLPVEVFYNKKANTNGQTEYINKDEEFVLHHATQSDEEIVFNHGVKGRIGYKTTIPDERLHASANKYAIAQKRIYSLFSDGIYSELYNPMFSFEQ